MLATCCQVEEMSRGFMPTMPMEIFRHVRFRSLGLTTDGRNYDVYVLPSTVLQPQPSKRRNFEGSKVAGGMTIQLLDISLSRHC